MSTRAEIDARKAALAAVTAGHNTYAGAYNAGAQALTPLSADFQPLIVKLNQAATAHNESVPLITAATALWNAAVPSDPIVTPSTPSPEGTFGPVVTDGLHTFSFGGAHPLYPLNLMSLRDGVPNNGGGLAYLYFRGNVYITNEPKLWYVWQDTWVSVPGDPRVIQPQPNGPSLRSQYTDPQLASAAPGTVPGLIKYLRVHPTRAAMLAEGWSNIGIDYDLRVSEFRQFPEYPGIDFVRLNSNGFDHGSYVGDPAYPTTTISSWRYHLPQQLNRAGCTYVIKLTKSVAKAFAELGLKLPGFESLLNQWGGFSARSGTDTPNGMSIAQCQATTDAQWDTMNVTYPFRMYEYRPDTGNGFGESVEFGVTIPEEVFVFVDLIMEMNNPIDPANIQGILAAWKADGKREVWINDQRVRLDSNVVWRINPDAGIENFFHNIYHGGTTVFDDADTSTPFTDGAEVWIGSTLITDGSVRGGMPLPIAQAGTGPLAGLPSAPGPHIAAIQALGSNQWMQLPPTTPDPTWGSNTGRSWNGRLAYAADLGGCFISGQGPHGAVQANGRYDNMFFWDYRANKYTCIEPGINTPTFAADVTSGAIKIDPVKKYLVYADGKPVYAQGYHTYLNAMYDPDNKVYCSAGWVNGRGGDQHIVEPGYANPWYKDAQPTLQAQETALGVTQAFPSYDYVVSTGKINREGGGGFLWIPSEHAAWVYANNVTYLNGIVATTGTLPPTGVIDCVCVHDPLRNRVYMGRMPYTGEVLTTEGTMYVFDVQTKGWSLPPPTASTLQAPGTNSAVSNMDTHADRVVMIGKEHHNAAWSINADGVTTWNPNDGTWGPIIPFPPAIQLAYMQLSGFYCPELNVHFIYVAPDGGVGTWWAYRYLA